MIVDCISLVILLSNCLYLIIWPYRSSGEGVNFPVQNIRYQRRLSVWEAPFSSTHKNHNTFWISNQTIDEWGLPSRQFRIVKVLPDSCVESEILQEAWTEQCVDQKYNVVGVERVEFKQTAKFTVTL